MFSILLYFFSFKVTEQEIQHGILSQNEQTIRRRTLTFIRNINEFMDKLGKNPRLESRFFEVDSENKIKVESTRLLYELKAKLGSKYERKNEFNVKWNENGGVTFKNHEEYFRAFGDRFESEIKSLIRDFNQQQPMKEYATLEDQLLLQEIVDHALLCKKYSEKFVGRDDLVASVFIYIESSNASPFIIYGESGAGKSSLIARVAYLVRLYTLFLLFLLYLYIFVLYSR